MRRTCQLLSAIAFALLLWAGTATSAHAQGQDWSNYYHYPYYYFPHNYWPSMGPQWPEPAGSPYMRPPAYMAYPPFQEPHWRYEMFKPQKYYHGYHFWLDQF
jgi:hypothetical protein